MINTLQHEFQKIFGGGESAIRHFFAPGRVNLIGEHTDYNGGHVFPCALSIGTYAIVRLREDRLVKLHSTNFPDRGIISFTIDDLKYKKEDDWANYPKGVIHEFKQSGYRIEKGLDVLFYGNIPNGAGLSSSASIELVTSVLLKGLFELSIDEVDMALISQKAENDFMNVNCGIMDQFAIAMGKENHAILLDCNTLQYRYSQLPLDNVSLVIGNTNKRRGLADSKYNERRSECEKALKIIQAHLPVNTLGDLTPNQFEEVKGKIPNEVIRKRAKHAVYENARTIQAVNLLQNGDMKGFGALMNASHISLRDDYEVTGHELDSLVAAAWNQEGVLGARMTGAGFGGCIVSLIETEHLEAFMENVKIAYKESTGLHADFYIVDIGDGARELVEI
ncbi:galactokinase [Sutcliffiella rhizosphaerae]|uniref:Galactokinase n=1 Tax=Sutcliffiella rhizosphaerae TaxID=2880967 RepID=A0ABM8YMY1_9BACI|nr:galactokinase [Sutcliffiella rhizosphaerae]CAG9621100.1 Galactokinase [Sutcliffiella rhizosphaerae]